MDFLMKTADVSHLLALLVFLTSVSYSVADPPRSVSREEVCERWNCPCAGRTVTRRPHHNPEKRFNIWQLAHHARSNTQSLLRRMENERFGGNDDHIRALRTCIDAREDTCLDVHLDGQCDMSSLPPVSRMAWSEFATDPSVVTSFSQLARSLLGTLAVYIEKAREDEETHHHSSGLSMAEDIRDIEERGIYEILCQLQENFNQRGIDWDTRSFTRRLMEIGCRSFNDRAPVDNRNYMVFYTLEKLLHNVGGQFERIAK